MKRKVQVAAYKKRNKQMKQIIVKQEEGNVQHLTEADQLVIARNQKKVLWAKVHMAKAMAESANVTSNPEKLMLTRRTSP
jgi:hypothetical protein